MYRLDSLCVCSAFAHCTTPDGEFSQCGERTVDYSVRKPKQADRRLAIRIEGSVSKTMMRIQCSLFSFQANRVTAEMKPDERSLNAATGNLSLILSYTFKYPTLA